MSHLDDFLAHHIETYLFYDIRFMERDDENGGGVGYPMLMTCCAGIEFLGALRSPTRFQAHSTGYQYFADYWQSCLYPAPSPNNPFYQPVYQLIRHGIAHSFFTKGDIGVVRKQPNLHFTRNASGLMLVDAVQLGRDLIGSYGTHIKPILIDSARAAEKANMELRLSEMETDFATQATKNGGNFPGAGLGSLPGATGAVTQSVAMPGSLGPTGPLHRP
jgi:hypothetical protein